MKHARKWLACLLAGALALAVLAGCSALMGGTVQKDTEQAKALMKEVDPSLTYNTDLEDATSRLADWLVEDSTQLTTQSGLLTRKVPMTTGSVPCWTRMCTILSIIPPAFCSCPEAW